jgi:hypothetical protein
MQLAVSLRMPLMTVRPQHFVLNPPYCFTNECVSPICNFRFLKKTTVAPEEMIWFLTLALLAPLFSPLTFQQIIL